jgi:hypothetical protein
LLPGRLSSSATAALAVNERAFRLRFGFSIGACPSKLNFTYLPAHFAYEAALEAWESLLRGLLRKFTLRRQFAGCRETKTSSHDRSFIWCSTGLIAAPTAQAPSCAAAPRVSSKLTGDTSREAGGRRTAYKPNELNQRLEFSQEAVKDFLAAPSHCPIRKSPQPTIERLGYAI